MLEIKRWSLRGAGVAVLLAAGCGGAQMKESVRRNIDEVMRARQPEITDCYRAALQRDAKTTGTVVIGFGLGANQLELGTPTVVSSNIADEELKRCVVQVTGGLRISQPSPRPLDVSYPLELTPL